MFVAELDNSVHRRKRREAVYDGANATGPSPPPAEASSGGRGKRTPSIARSNPRSTRPGAAVRTKLGALARTTNGNGQMSRALTVLR